MTKHPVINTPCECGRGIKAATHNGQILFQVERCAYCERERSRKTTRAAGGAL